MAHNPPLLQIKFVSILSTGVCKSLLELIYTSAYVDKLLLAGEEGVALGANFNSDLATLRRLGGYGFAASATNNALFIVGMNSGFHCFYLVSNIPMFFDIGRKHSYYSTTVFELQEVFEKKSKNFSIFIFPQKSLSNSSRRREMIFFSKREM